MGDPSVRRFRRPVAGRRIVLASLIVGCLTPNDRARCQFELLPRLVGDMKGGDGFDGDDEYDRFRRRQRIHRMHLVGYAVSSVLILIRMLLFWH